MSERSSREGIVFAGNVPMPTSNPLESPSRLRPTDTLPARAVFHEANAAIRSLTAHIQTREQMDDLLEKLDHLRYGHVLLLFVQVLTFTFIRQEQNDELHHERVREPPIITPKGRPRDQRLTGALEGRPRGGGAPKKPGSRNCGICRRPGHNRNTCPRLQY